MNEAETRAKLIDPALHARGWDEDLIRREVTAGRITIHGDSARQSRRGRADYVLRVKAEGGPQPVAVALIEAKKDTLPPTHGLDQGKAYARAKRMNVPFVFSSNGHQFVEYDRTTGVTGEARPMAEFPGPDALRARYEEAVGFGLDDAVAKPLLVPYAGGETSRRYYQDAAIRAVLEQTARQQTEGEPPRALLSMATGSGKTRIAVGLLRRLADGDQLRRALFVVDRDELRTQALGALQSAFGSDVRMVTAQKPETNARVLVATYQTLGITRDEAQEITFLREHYGEGYFSHIVIDECHRSAWGAWSEVLEMNAGAVQVGLTATPRRLVEEGDAAGDVPFEDRQITADNRAYFGEAAYEYTIGQAIADGYLAACDIRKGRVDLDETGVTLDQVMELGPTDAVTGRTLTATEVRDLYEARQFEDQLLLPDRVAAMTSDLFRYLVETGGPEQKTVVFCVRDHHADQVAVAMNNLYAAWCAEHGLDRKESYAFKCTAAGGKDDLASLRGSRTSHFVATTVDLLSTGVDLPSLRNVAFFRYLKSPILFYQMVGRGTRLDPATGKLMFRVYDYTNATRLFGQDFVTELRGPTGGDGGGTTDGDGGGDEPDEAAPLVSVAGFDVEVRDEGRFVLAEVDGEERPVSLEDYKAWVAAALLEEAPTAEALRAVWVDPRARAELLHGLPQEGQSARLVQRMDELEACDLFDVLAELGYGLAPRTRRYRSGAFEFKHGEWLDALPPKTAATLRALAGQFTDGGVEALETASVFQAPAVVQAGGLPALQVAAEPATLLTDMKARIFAP